MVWSRKKEGISESEVVALGLLQRVTIAIMGCFFGCLRIKDSQPHLVSRPTTVRLRTIRICFVFYFIISRIRGFVFLIFQLGASGDNPQPECSVISIPF